ncbi:MAG: hypothetical protein FJ390_07770 [Verrucomicrobia bacterium]|nr:hypothetical protein [Verrucomicrobiota bacterium]
MIIQDQASKSTATQQAQVRASQVFFDALKKCYGDDFINELRSTETQKNPLTVGEAAELFKKIHESFEKLGNFFQKQPLLITKEYLDAVCNHPHLARQVEHDHHQLNPPESSLVQSMRRMIGTSILGAEHYAASSTYSLIAGAHASHLVVLGAASGALGVAAILGAAAGYAVMLVGGHERGQTQAAGVSAILTMEGTLGEIAATMVSPIFPDGGMAFNYIRDFLRSSLISAGIGLGVDATATVNAAHNAFIGGSVSGSLAVGEEVQDRTASSSHAPADQEELDIEDEVSLEARLGIKYALDVAWNLAANNVSKLVKALDRIPVDAASVEVLRSRRVNL